MTMAKLLIDNPNLVKEFHPTKNGNLTAENFSYKSGKKVWWKCSKDEEHEWIVSIANRSNGNNCKSKREGCL